MHCTRPTKFLFHSAGGQASPLAGALEAGVGAAAAAAGVAEEDEMHGGDAEAEGCTLGPWRAQAARCDDGGGRGAANSTDRMTSENLWMTRHCTPFPNMLKSL